MYIELLERRALLTVLTFDNILGDGLILDQRYGDRITTQTPYGPAGGPTPNVTVTYGPVESNVRTWISGYGDLSNVIYPGAAAGGILDIRLTADLGFKTGFVSLDLAGKNGRDFTIKQVQLFDGKDNLLWSQKNVLVQGDASGARHTSLSLPATGSRVWRIRVDASNLGVDGDKVGVDNITVSQSAGLSDVGDGFADVVLAFSDSGKGPVPGPYGGQHPDISNQAVSLGMILGDDPTTDVNYLSLPTGSYAIVGFADEVMIDGPGDDLVIPELVANGERANVYVSTDLVNYTFLGVAIDGTANKFDLATIGYTQPVHAVKIEGLDNFGESPGFDLVNVQVRTASMSAADDVARGMVFSTMDADGVIRALGTDLPDRIGLSTATGMIDVNLNGATMAWDSGIARALQVESGGGDDRVLFGAGLIGGYALGGSGNDTLIGGDGKDTLTGSAGKDRIFGMDGDDRLNGSGSKNYLDGGIGNDRLYGGPANDTMIGNAGVDRLFGSGGNDLLYGNTSNDKLYGQAGNDTLIGGRHADILDGGEGDDIAVADILDTLVSIEG